MQEGLGRKLSDSVAALDEESCGICQAVADARRALRSTTVDEHVVLKGPFLRTWEFLKLHMETKDPERLSPVAELPPTSPARELWGYFEALYLERDATLDRVLVEQNIGFKRGEFVLVLSWLSFTTENDQKFINEQIPVKIREELDSVRTG